MRPSWIIGFSVVVMPDMSTAVCDWNPGENFLRLGLRQLPEGAAVLVDLRGKDRIWGSIRGSLPAFGAAPAIWVSNLGRHPCDRAVAR